MPQRNVNISPSVISGDNTTMVNPSAVPTFKPSGGRTSTALPKPPKAEKFNINTPEPSKQYTPGYQQNQKISSDLWKQIGNQYNDEHYAAKATADWVNSNYAELDKMDPDYVRQLIKNRYAAEQGVQKQKIVEYQAAMDKSITAMKDNQLTNKLHSEIIGKAQDDAWKAADKLMETQQTQIWHKTTPDGKSTYDEKMVLAFDNAMLKNLDPKSPLNKDRWIRDPDTDKWVANPDWRPVRWMTVDEQEQKRQEYYQNYFKDFANQKLLPFGVDWTGKPLNQQGAVDATGQPTATEPGIPKIGRQYGRDNKGNPMYIDPGMTAWRPQSELGPNEFNTIGAQQPATTAVPVQTPADLVGGRVAPQFRDEVQATMPEQVTATSTAVPMPKEKPWIDPTIAASKGYINPITPEGGTYGGYNPSLPESAMQTPEAQTQGWDASAIADNLRSIAGTTYNWMQRMALPQNTME